MTYVTPRISGASPPRESSPLRGLPQLMGQTLSLSPPGTLQRACLCAREGIVCVCMQPRVCMPGAQDAVGAQSGRRPAGKASRAATWPVS